MSKSSLAVACSLAVTALLTLPLASQAASSQQPRPRCNNLRAIARAVQLTPAQVSDARGIYEGLRQAVEPLREQIPPLREALEDLLDTASPVAADVGQTVIDIDAIHDQIEVARSAADDAFAALLSADQLARWETFQENCREGYQHGG